MAGREGDWSSSFIGLGVVPVNDYPYWQAAKGVQYSWVCSSSAGQACTPGCVGGIEPNNRQSARGATSLAAFVVDVSAAGS